VSHSQFEPLSTLIEDRMRDSPVWLQAPRFVTDRRLRPAALVSRTFRTAHQPARLEQSPPDGSVTFVASTEYDTGVLFRSEWAKKISNGLVARTCRFAVTPQIIGPALPPIGSPCKVNGERRRRLRQVSWRRHRRSRQRNQPSQFLPLRLRRSWPVHRNLLGSPLSTLSTPSTPPMRLLRLSSRQSRRSCRLPFH
jgi:hypothetical protein